MDKENVKLASALIGDTYSKLGIDAMNSLSKKVRVLLTQKQIPAQPWSSLEIEQVLLEISSLDSNNYADRAGVGEREGRCFSHLVARRNYYLTHGIGRSGDLLAVQPKAAGSSIISHLAQSFALHALQISGVHVAHCALVPLATGMTLSLVFQTLRQQRPVLCKQNARYVVWTRIDQKTCLKSICAAGFEPLVVPPQLLGDSVSAGDIESFLTPYDPSQILCVSTTTSCFAPRIPDPVLAISQLCKRLNLPHVINNAYGLQCSKITHQISEAVRLGRVDAIVQSTDKNFLMPVGGAVIGSPTREFIDAVSALYPGRATVAISLDFFITMLEMGVSGYQELLLQRKELIPKFINAIKSVAEKHGERVLDTSSNTISFAVSLTAFSDASVVGAKLFARRVSGTRVVLAHNTKTVCGKEFRSYGASIDDYPTDYITAACAIGLTASEIDRFAERLDALLTDLKNTVS